MAAVIDGVVVAVPPPEGYIVDFDNPPRTSVPEVYVVAGIGMFLAFFFLCQRLYVKTFIRRKLGFDDALLLLGWLSSIAIQTLIICSFAEGFMGIHSWEMPIEKFKLFALYPGYISTAVYSVPTCLCKVVILLFLLDINSNQKWYRWVCYSGIFLVVSSNTAIFFGAIFGCTPFRKNYDITVPPEEGECIDRVALYLANAIIAVITDVIIISIPIPVVIKLHVSMKKKIGLMLMFVIGSVTVITSAIFTGYVVENLGVEDQPWDGASLNVIICAEANLLVICACLSTLPQFVKEFGRRFGLTTTTDNSRYGSSYGPRKHYGTGRSRNHELQTIGSTADRPRAGPDAFGAPYTNIETQVHAGNSMSDIRPQGHSDDSSEKGIIRKDETHVYYSQA